MHPKPVTNAYSDRRLSFHCLDEVIYDGIVDIGGSGVMAWHSDFFFPDYEKITKKNMADIWVAKFAKEQGIKIIMNPHRSGWIHYLQPDNTIWDQTYEHPEEITELYNSF